MIYLTHPVFGADPAPRLTYCMPAIKRMNYKPTLLFLFLLLSTITQKLSAESILNLAPSPDDACALYVGAGQVYNAQNIFQGHFGEFAYMDSPAKLYFNIQNTETEIVYLAFSLPTINRDLISDFVEDVRFRILAPDGTPITCWGTYDQSGDEGSGWQNLDSNTANLQIGSTGYGEVIQGPNVGYIPFVFDPSALSCNNILPGDYVIEFFQDSHESNVGFYIENFEIAVHENDTRLTGRVWSNNWGIGIKRDDLDNFDINFGRAFNGQFYACDQNNFITRIDFNSGSPTTGFRGGSFNVFFNSSGVRNTGDILIDRKSVEDDNAFDPNQSSESKVFLEEPDVNIFPQPTTGNFQLLNPFITRCAEDEYCFNISTNDAGQVDILLDFDDDGIFDEGVDIILDHKMNEDDLVTAPVDPAFPYERCLAWNGLDATGTPAIPISLNVKVFFRQGVFHFPVNDLEYNDAGFVVETIRPCVDECRLELHFDDTAISENNNLGPKRNLDGCLSPCHPWSSGNPNFGNKNTINTWWYAYSAEETITVNAQVEYLECSITGSNTICTDSVTNFTATVTSLPSNNAITQNLLYAWEGPNGFNSNTAETGPISTEGTYSVTVTALLNNCTYQVTESLSLLPASSEACCALRVDYPSPDGGTYTCLADIPEPNFSIFEVTNSCYGNVTFDSEDVITGGGGCSDDPLVITRSWSIFDNDNDPNTTDETIYFEVTYQLVDSEAPVIDACPITAVLGCEADLDPATSALLSAPTVSNNCLAPSEIDISYTDFFIPFTCPSSGQIERTWSVKDNCGNETTCIQYILIQDTATPTVTCPDDIILACEDALPDPYTTAAELMAVSGNIQDNCSTTFTVSAQGDQQIEGADTDCPLDDIYQRTYQVTDECNFSASCIQIIRYEGDEILCCPAPLPVEWVDFYATKKDAGILLNWETDSEKDNSHFIIQKSSDGLSFVDIGKVNSQGNSNSLTVYQFLDPETRVGNYYYRIAQHDFDGKFTYSKIIVITLSHKDVMHHVSDELFQVFHTNNHLSLSLNITETETNEFTEFLITDITGRPLSLKATQMSTSNYTFATNHLAAGIYAIRVRVGQRVLSKLFVVQY